MFYSQILIPITSDGLTDNYDICRVLLYVVNYDRFLQSNQITRIEHGAFATTVSLEWLKLSRNRLRSLQKHTFHALQQLKYL